MSQTNSVDTAAEGTNSNTVYYLLGRSDYPAHRIGNPKKDECGQTPWRFIGGPWKDEIVMVEPHKMVREVERRAA